MRERFLCKQNLHQKKAAESRLAAICVPLRECPVYVLRDLLHERKTEV